MSPMTDERESMLQVFAAEAQELLAKMERELTALEARSDDAEILDHLARSVARLEESARQAHYEPASELTRDVAALIDRLRALAAPLRADHILLLQRTLVALFESTSDALAGVLAAGAEVLALREQIRRIPP